MDHDEVFEDTWRNQTVEWSESVKIDVVCSIFSYASYNKVIEKVLSWEGSCLTLPSSVLKYIIRLRVECVEPTLTCRDKNMKWFVRQSFKKGRWTGFNRSFKYKNGDRVFENVSEKINVKGTICDVPEVYDEGMGKKSETRDKEYDSIFQENRRNDVE